MLIKPLSARALWTLAVLAAVYFCIAFTIQFPAGYWDPFTSAPPSPVPQTKFIVECPSKSASARITPQKHSPEKLDGWDADPYIGEWDNLPATENYESLLSGTDRGLLDELSLYAGPSGLKSSRIDRFYSLDSEEDWEDYLSKLDEKGLAPLTKFAQSYIRNHQHPTNCTDKKFMVVRKFPNDEAFGLGAVIQSIATQLSLAIRTNRILIYNAARPPGMHFLQTPDPKNGSPDGCGQSLDCIFHKLTSCTHADVAKATGTVHFPWTAEVPELFYKTHPNSLPPVLGQALRNHFPDMIADAMKYWWRGQVAAYIMRPNGATMKRLRELRTDPKLHEGFHMIKGAHQGVGKSLEMQFPIPDGAFSMHVRHGDKGIEMNLVEFRDYVLQAEKHVLKNPMSSRKIAFLSTEDPGVIEEARNISSLLTVSTDKGWEWYWSKIPRFNGGPETQLQLFGNRTEMTIKWLLQLTMALECETFVGTRGSGWNRLIDQLRCTWHPNCQSSYLEVGDYKSWALYGF